MEVEEVKRLKEIIKQKNIKLRDANKLIKRLKESVYGRSIAEQVQYLKGRRLELITEHLEEHMFEVDFMYNDQTIRNRKIKAFNSRHLEISIALDICRVEKFVAHTYDIDILNVKKLW